MQNLREVPVTIEEEMKDSYIDYAMSVIVSRALPDVRDGLKPGNRRILIAMNDLSLTSTKKHVKSAKVCGDTSGNYHPHGEQVIYPTLARMAQGFILRYPLVDGQGNFGSIDGDPPAAMRYTEVRMSKIAEEMMSDIDKKTVDFVPNYDGTRLEPVVLPSKIPNLLINGSSGIAVGMATSIPPHNISEISDAVIYYLKNPTCTTENLMNIVRGPDFPTGGIILGKSGIQEAYRTGKGKIIVRARAEIQEMGERERIIVTEIPYQVNKALMIEGIADLVRDKKVDGISDIRDESDRSGLRVVIELKRETNAQITLNQLFKHSTMQQTFGIIMLALSEGQPRIFSLVALVKAFVDHRCKVVRRRIAFDLEKAEDREHILAGLIVALENIDEVITIIRQAKSSGEAKEGISKRYSLSEKQAAAILDMKLSRLTKLERDEIRTERGNLLSLISELKSILASEQKILEIIQREMEEIKQKYADERRTEITEEEVMFETEDLIPEESIAVIVTHEGYIKRLPVDTYRSQKRGGKGVIGMEIKEQDFVELLFTTTTHNYILFFTNKGRVYWLKGYDIPEANRVSKGKAIINLLRLAEDEKVRAMIPIRQWGDNYFLFFGTKQGLVKKTPLSEYSNVRPGGIIAISLVDGDDLMNVKLTDGTKEVILATRKGKSIRFSEPDVRSMGRNTMGVKGIELEEMDEVVSMATIDEDTTLLTLTEKGYAKRTDVGEYPLQNRGGKGVINTRVTERNGNVVAVKCVREEDGLMIVSSSGKLIRTEAAQISRFGRGTQGVKTMELGEGDTVSTLTRVEKED
jgi:DNA gyrase subunit A